MFEFEVIFLLILRKKILSGNWYIYLNLLRLKSSLCVCFDSKSLEDRMEYLEFLLDHGNGKYAIVGSTERSVVLKMSKEICVDI
jgi:hypothetical protein